MVYLSGKTTFYSPLITGEDDRDSLFQSLTLDGDNILWDARNKKDILGYVYLGVFPPPRISLVFAHDGRIVNGTLIVDSRDSSTTNSNSVIDVDVAGYTNWGVKDVNPKGVTLLSFSVKNDEIYWNSNYSRPIGLIEGEILTLRIAPDGYDGDDFLNTSLATFTYAFNLLKDKAPYIRTNKLVDGNPLGVVIEVLGNLEQTIHAKSLPRVGILIKGVGESAPTINSWGVVSQFNRNTLIDDCWGLRIENLHLSNLDPSEAKTPGCLAVKNSQEITFENLIFSCKGTIITILNSSVVFNGSFRFLDGLSRVLNVSGFSRVRFHHTTASYPTYNLKNTGLDFFFESVSLEQFCSLADFSQLQISDRLAVSGDLTIAGPSTLSEFSIFNSSYFT